MTDDFSDHLRYDIIVHEMLSTRERQSGRSRPRSSSVELDAKPSAKRLTLSVGDVSTSRPLKRTGIVDLFLLRMLFAILQKSLQPRR